MAEQGVILSYEVALLATTCIHPHKHAIQGVNPAFNLDAISKIHDIAILNQNLDSMCREHPC